MAYKISGTVSDDCDIYVINSASDIIDKVESVSAGAYEIGLLTAPNVHILAVHPTKGARSYSYIDAEYYSYVQPTFGLSLKEVKRHADYVAGVSFSNPEANVVRGYNASSALGYANTFCSFETSILDGNSMTFDWSGIVGSGDTGSFVIEIVDGSYDRTSATDFVLGSPWVSKGAGQLVEVYSASLGASFSRYTINSGTLDLSLSTQGYVTVFVRVSTSYGRYASYDLYGMEVRSPSNAIITQADMSGTLVWPEGFNPTADYEYGKVGTPVIVETQ